MERESAKKGWAPDYKNKFELPFGKGNVSVLYEDFSSKSGFMNFIIWSPELIKMINPDYGLRSIYCTIMGDYENERSCFMHIEGSPTKGELCLDSRYGDAETNICKRARGKWKKVGKRADRELVAAIVKTLIKNTERKFRDE